MRRAGGCPPPARRFVGLQNTTVKQHSEKSCMVSADKNSSSYRGLLDTSQDERVLVLDFGGQTAQLIARRIRDHNVLCQVVRHDLPAERIRAINPRGLILSGGPASVYEERAPEFDPAIFELDIPVLGICYGMHVAC